MRYFCDSPFTNMTIHPNGNVYVCCAAWTNAYSIGNAFSQTFEQIWNSPKAQALRASIHDGSFRHCNAAKCGRLAEGELSSNEMFEKNAELIKSKDVTLENGPSKMTLNYDPSCNLSCRSCRKELIYAPSSEVERLIAFQETVLASDYFNNVKRIRATGTGDVFASKVYAHLLDKISAEKYPDLRLELRTNGILLTPKKWASISNTHYAIDQIIISVDAATKSTYEFVRGKGFDKLISNLEFLGKIKETTGFRLELWFVMQAANYREIPDFARLGKRIGADKVLFTRLQNWGTYDNFAQENVFDKNHPEHHRYLRIMQDPVLNDPVVKVRHSPIRGDEE
jgi:radical SAM protein with 4Fe4S-binding SPASM domain